MIKQILLATVLAVAFTMNVGAVTVHELETSPRYKSVYEHVPDVPDARERTVYYVDTESITVLQYEPPLYTIQADIYSAYTSPRKHSLHGTQWTLTYDTRQSIASHVYRAQVNHQPIASAIKAAQATSGMVGTEHEIGWYNPDGTINTSAYHRDDSTRAILRIQPNTVRYNIADALFYAAYNMHFDDIVVK